MAILVAFLGVFSTAGGGGQCHPFPTEPGGGEVCNTYIEGVQASWLCPLGDLCGNEPNECHSVLDSCDDVMWGTPCGWDEAAGVELVCFEDQCLQPLGYCHLDAPMDMGEMQCLATSGGTDWGTFCESASSTKGGQYSGFCHQCLNMYPVDGSPLIARGCTADAPVCVYTEVGELRRPWWHCEALPTESCSELPNGTVCGFDDEARNLLVCYEGECVPEGIGYEPNCDSDVQCPENFFCDGTNHCTAYDPTETAPVE